MRQKTVMPSWSENSEQLSTWWLAKFFLLNLDTARYTLCEKNEQLPLTFLNFLKNDKCLQFNFEERNAFFKKILLWEGNLSLIVLVLTYKSFAKLSHESHRNFSAKIHIYFWNLQVKLSKKLGASFGFIGTRKPKRILKKSISPKLTIHLWIPSLLFKHFPKDFRARLKWKEVTEFIGWL